VSSRLRVAAVGAGPVLHRYHMPAINAVPEVVRSLVVDADGERARRAAERYGFPQWSTELSPVRQYADLAIVLVPNGWHAAVSCELLAQGIPVLCEKPMARNEEECARMIGASRRGGALLCIGHNRRFRKHMWMAKDFLERDLIGRLSNIVAQEGSTADWQRSPAYFDPEQSGGGALMDVGIHSIDLIRWLAGDFREVKYSGNSSAGMVESEAEMTFTLANGARGSIIASRIRDLPQTIRFDGDQGFIEVGLWAPSLKIRSARGKMFQNFPHLEIAESRRPPQDASFVEQLRNFVSAIRGDQELLVTGEEGMANIAVICRAYGRAVATGASQS
jgi:predicted dehydrogenase